MAMVPATCPSCKKDIQIPEELEETFCSYCGSKIRTETATELHSETHGTEGAASADGSAVLAELRKLRQQELESFFSGPGVTSFHGGLSLKSKHNAQIESIDPQDMLSKEMRICEELRKMLYEACGDQGLFAPAGIRYIGNKVLVSAEYEILVKQHIDSINADASALAFIKPGYDFEALKDLFLALVKRDQTPELYGLFSNGLVMAYLALQHVFIPAAIVRLIPPLGDRIAESFGFISELIASKLEEKDLQYAKKVQVRNLKKLELLK